jgi:hypothetical protein
MSLFDHLRHKTDRQLLEEILIAMSANDDALTALTTAVTANTAATTAAVAAIGSESDDISAGVNAQTALVEANTTALNNAVTPPAPPATDTTDAPAPAADTSQVADGTGGNV